MATVTTKDAEPKRSQPLWRAHKLRAIVDFAVESHGRAVAVLVIASLLAFLPGFFQIPPMDRDEARFAQATKQMVETGDYVDIRFQDEVRYKKPVGIYWLQATVVETAGKMGLPRAQVRIWLYRVPSLAGAIGAVLMTYWAALAFVGRRGAVVAGLILCSSILLGVEARLAKTDAFLLKIAELTGKPVPESLKAERGRAEDLRLPEPGGEDGEQRADRGRSGDGHGEHRRRADDGDGGAAGLTTRCGPARHPGRAGRCDRRCPSTCR